MMSLTARVLLVLTWIGCAPVAHPHAQAISAVSVTPAVHREQVVVEPVSPKPPAVVIDKLDEKIRAFAREIAKGCKPHDATFWCHSSPGMHEWIRGRWPLGETGEALWTAADSTRTALSMLEGNDPLEKYLALILTRIRTEGSVVYRDISDPTLARRVYALATAVHADDHDSESIGVIAANVNAPAAGVLPELKKLSEIPVPHFQTGLARAFEMHPNEHTLAIVRTMLSNPSFDVQRAAISALATHRMGCDLLSAQTLVPDGDVSSYAISMLASHESCPGHREDALGLLIKRTSAPTSTRQEVTFSEVWNLEWGLGSICGAPSNTPAETALRVRAAVGFTEMAWADSVRRRSMLLLKQCDPAHAWGALLRFTKSKDPIVAEAADEQLDEIRRGQLKHDY